MQPPPAISYPPDLPISARREEIVAALRTHQVLIVAGETGSGKTTQLPKMCLEAGLAERGRTLEDCTQHDIDAWYGSGPVDACFKAIESIADSGAELLLYSVNAITTGTDAQGEVTVRLSKDGRIVNGNGSDTDIVIASAKSYLNALNKLHFSEVRLNPQGDI